MKHGKVGAFLLWSVLLTGCVHQAAQLPQGNWSERQAHLNKLSHWQVTGKLGVRIPGDNGSANLRWRQENNEYTINLSGPLGSGRIAISGAPGHVSLQQGGDEPLTAPTAEELIFYSTGWTIPVAQLVYWVRALPAPEQKVVRREQNELGQLSLLEQNGWRVHYSHYQTVNSATPGENVLLPGRVLAEYGDVRLTLVIREWHLEEGENP